MKKESRVLIKCYKLIECKGFFFEKNGFFFIIEAAIILILENKMWIN